MRTGIGYDIHALKKGRKLVLGGVAIPFNKGLAGHSDADALYHALVDALLGAMGEGDIGAHFSDTDPAFKNAGSALFASKTKALLKRKGWSVANVDAVILAELPKMGPYREAMKKNIARDFGIALDRIGIKAKTNEGFGAIGKGDAIACWATALIEKSTKSEARSTKQIRN
ncbi:MAG: 2-C-methyl-D-erythritol 2,4-cyclodiphosphate synthase [Candidatus Omnitrophica bacterium]|nr:2-C-methyl-D-erythritol 2,4-cyclodiphosphate synthase [Candidatus Omnitrophota bacterium]